MAADHPEGDGFTPTVSRDSTERLEDGLEHAPHDGLHIEGAPGFVEPRDEGGGEPVQGGRPVYRKTPAVGED